jgi:hypothetical protein
MSESIALWAQLLVFVAIVIGYSFDRSASMFHPLTFYFLFHFIVFVLRPFMVYYLGFEGRWVYMGFRPTQDQFNFTLFLSTIALLVFTLVCWITGRSEPDLSRVNLKDFTSAQSKALVWTWGLLGPLAVYSAFFAAQPVGFDDDVSDIQMTTDIVTGTTIYVNTTGYLVDAQTMLGPLAVMLMWRFRFALWTWGLLIAFVLYRSFLGGGRWVMITTILMLILIQLLRRKKKWFQIRYVAVLFPVFFLFQTIGADRNVFRDYVGAAPQVQQFSFKYRDERTWLQKQDNPDFANFEFLAFILWAVPDRSHTYTYFTQYLQLFTEPIPRILWPSKPVGAPVKILNLNDYGNFVGLTTSLVGDGWISAGWLGVVVTMSIVGFILGLYHRRFWQRIDNPQNIMIYCTFLPLVIVWFRDGGISIAKYALFTIFPILVWQLFTKIIAESESNHLLLRARRQPKNTRRPP